ncbi:MAG: ArsC family reductase [Psychromonas sp.]
MTTLYGIANCDAIKKAQTWLTQNNIPYSFHNYRKEGLNEKLLHSFLAHLSWTDLLNKRSTSYRALSSEQKEALNEDNVIALFIEFPTLIKRPLLIHHNKSLLGFKIESYKALFAV